MESDRTDPPLTAADLDEIDAKRKAAQVGECSYEPNGTTLDGTEVGALLIAGGRATYIMAAPGRYAAALLNIAPSLLALARRGLEADIREYTRGYEAASRAAETLLGVRQRDLAAALAEVERVRGRLERATNFSWRNGAVWVVRPEDSTLWRAYEEYGSCGAALIGKYDSLDAAWSAAEQAQAGQAAKQGGEGRA